MRAYDRGENPVGTWVLKVKDQNRSGVNGTFLGWNMALWGSTIDPAKAKNYEVPVIENRLPPIDASESIPVPSPASSTKQHTKPTAHLPGDHGVVTGENTKPAFATATSAAAEATPTASPPAVSGTPDVGWFSDLGKLVQNQKWFFGALAVVSMFGISAGIFFWRRRSKRLANYSSLRNDEDVGMSALGSSMSEPRTTRELYDAFGEVSDEDDDETTALRQPVEAEFLDDEASAIGASAYRDVPEDSEEIRLSRDREQSASPSGSGDGSWDHASRE
jgi:kexin